MNNREAVEQLLRGGMCCNGVLFGDVELQPRDDAKRLATLDMELFPKGRNDVSISRALVLTGSGVAFTKTGASLPHL